MHVQVPAPMFGEKKRLEKKSRGGNGWALVSGDRWPYESR